MPFRLLELTRSMKCDSMQLQISDGILRVNERNGRLKSFNPPFQYLANDFIPPLLRESVMDPKELFHLTEKTVQGIGGIGHLKRGISLEREQKRKIGPQASIRRSDLLMRVLPMNAILFEGLLSDEIFPLFMPFIQSFREYFFRSRWKRSADHMQLPPREELGFRGEIAFQDGELMEMAHLHGNIGEDFSNTFSSVQDYGLYVKSLLFNPRSRFPIDADRFRFGKVPKDVLLEFRRSKDKYPVASIEEGDVADENEGLRRGDILNGSDVFQNLPYPRDAPSMFF